MTKFDDLKLEILYAFREAAYVPGSKWFTPFNELPNVIPGEKLSAATYVAIQALVSEHLLQERNGNYSISPSGMLFIDQEIDTPRLLSVINASGHSRDDRNAPSAPVVVPASDRLVTLDHNSDPYKEAINALDAAVTAFKEDRRLENDWGPEKGVLLQSIKAGQRLLKEAQVRVATICAVVIDPLKIIIDRYRDAIAAGLITAAVDQTLPLLKRAMTSVLTLLGLNA